MINANTQGVAQRGPDSGVTRAQDSTDSVDTFTFQNKDISGRYAADVQQPVRVVTQIILLKRPTTLADVVPFAIMFFVYCIAIQLVLSLWKRGHKKSFDLFIFALVFFFPPLLLYTSKDYIFLSVWSVMIFLLAVCFFKLSKRPMPPSAPREVYNIFKGMFLFSNFFITVSYLTLVAIFVYIYRISLFSLRMLIYSLYVAVLSREAARNMSFFMAKTTGFFSEDGVPGRQESNERCMICTGGLAERGENIISLVCGHNYHEKCIRGWQVIGHNEFCPYCKHGIGKDFLSKNMWERAEYFFRPLTDFLRSFIVYFILILVIFIVRKDISDW